MTSFLSALSSERGFLPIDDPLVCLPEPFDDWEQAARQLPKLLVSDQLRQTLAGLPPFPVEALSNARERERAMTLLSYLGHAYVWGAAQPATVLPARLAVPWHALATQLGRPPVLSYASYSLHNWYRLDRRGPVACGNIALIQNFLGGIDEEWFILIHVEIEQRAAAGIAVLAAGQQAAADRDTAALTRLLTQLHTSLDGMHATMLRMPEHCDPYIYYHRVRPYIHGWKNHPDLPAGLIYEGVAEYGGAPKQFRGETGAQSSIVPALDAVLGVAHQPDELRVYLTEMRSYMPPDHRAFLESLEAHPPVRDFVAASGDAALRDVYDACVGRLEDFRSLHLEYAARYIFRQAQTDPKNPHAVGTGGTPFMQYLKKHRDETAAHRLAPPPSR